MPRWLLLVPFVACRGEPDCLQAGECDNGVGVQHCVQGNTAWFAFDDGHRVDCAARNDCLAAEDERRDYCDEISPADTDTDTDADSDTDTDTDVDSDTDTDPVDTLCDGSFTPPAPGEAGLGDCITDEIGCGDTIEATTEGGSTHYDSAHYRGWYCETASGSKHAAPERVYVLEVPPSTQAKISLEACDPDLQLRVLTTSFSDVCPAEGNTTIACERDSNGPQEITVTTAGNAKRFELVVDGANDAIDNFRLDVACTP